MCDKIKILDITSMLNEDLQKVLYNSSEDNSSKRISQASYVINNLKLENFFKCEERNSLYFRRYGTYDVRDEIKYSNYNATYSMNMPDEEKKLINERNEIFGNSAYVLPMYYGRDVSTLHFNTYGANGGIGAAVKYKLSALLKSLIDNAWGKSTKDRDEKMPVISLEDNDRIFCGGVQYMALAKTDEDNNFSFDPANAVVPFYLKRYCNKADTECRLCLIRTPEIRVDNALNNILPQNIPDNSVEGVYVPVGNIFNSIESIYFMNVDKSDSRVKEEYEVQIGRLKEKAERAGYILHKQGKSNVIYDEYQLKPSITQRGQAWPIFKQAERPVIRPVLDKTQQRAESGHSFTLFGDKYDSMKQRYILMHGNREHKYTRYNTSLKYDMLLWGKVTITDAQYFDGMLFTQMIEHGHFSDFIHCAYNHDSLEIRRRCVDSNEFILKMFGKKFYYSSIQSYEMAKMVEKANARLEEYSEKDRKRYCENIEEYWNFIERELQFKEYSEQIELMKKWYNTLSNVYEELFEGWEYINFDEKYYEFLIDGDSFNKAIKIAEMINSYTDTVSRLCSKIINKCKVSREQFRMIKDFRTDVIKSNIDEIIQIASRCIVNEEISQENFKNICDDCGHLTNEFNRAYNKVLAMQHKCRFMEYSNKSCPAFDRSGQETENIKFDKEALNYISSCSWKEFDKLLNDKFIQEARSELFQILQKGAGVKGDSDAVSISRLTAAYDKLNKAVSRYCSQAANSKENKSEYSIFDINAESTNYFTVRGNEHQDGDLYFIGCGSELTENETNDLYIFMPNIESGPKLFCIYFDEEPQGIIDSIICPTDFKIEKED